jgi:hypothetical protein
MASAAQPLSSFFPQGYQGGPVYSQGGPFQLPISQQGGTDFNGGPVPYQGPQSAPIVANGSPATGTVTSGVPAVPASQMPPAGSSAAGTLGSYLQPFQNWNTPFVAPNAQQAAQTPGEQFEMQQGVQALDNSAAARGTLLTGGTGKALEQYGQGLASTNYQQAYNDALTNFQTNYNLFSNNQNNQFNRLASLAGLGQTSAGQLNASGSNAANNFSNILLGSGQQIGNDVQNAGAALASGQVGSANAIGGAINNLSSFGSLLPFLSQQSGGNVGGITTGTSGID